MFPFRAFLFPSQETMTTWQSLGLKTALNNAAAIAHFLNQLWYVSGDIFLSRTQVEIKHWKTVTACFLTAEERDHLATHGCPQTSSPQPSRHLQPTLFFLISQGVSQGDEISTQKTQKLKHQTAVSSFLSHLCSSARCSQDMSCRLSAWPPTWVWPHPCFLTSYPQPWALSLCALSGAMWSSISQK